jgi:mannitol/fructose-specific phosphotransferase system IIA component (Ntr-type)
MKLLDLVRPDGIIAELEATERNGAVRELAEALVANGQLRPEQLDAVTKSIIARERTRGTTGFGKGAAVPHAKLEGLARVVAAVGRSSRGIDFASLDGKPVYTVFLILSPSEQPEEHLKAMDLVFRRLHSEQFRKFLRQSDTQDKLYDLLKEADEQPLLK